MHLALGCLVWVLVLAVAWVAQYRLLADLPWAPVVATLLALLLTLLLGSLAGLIQAIRLRAALPNPPPAWRDGETVRVSGCLWPLAEPVLAPISRQPAVFCHYAGKMPDTGVNITSNQGPHWRGRLEAPCQLQVGAQRIRVLGVPTLREVPRKDYRGPAYIDRAAQHLADTTWHIAPHLGELDLKDLGKALEAGLADLPPHLINTAALERLQLVPGQTQAPALAAALASNDWQFGERLVPPGAEVILVGTYRAAAGAIDIGLSASHAYHALQLGTAGANARRQVGVALAFVLVLGVLSAAAHGAVFAQQGAWYRALLQAMDLPG